MSGLHAIVWWIYSLSHTYSVNHELNIALPSLYKVRCEFVLPQKPAAWIWQLVDPVTAIMQSNAQPAFWQHSAYSICSSVCVCVCVWYMQSWWEASWQCVNLFQSRHCDLDKKNRAGEEPRVSHNNTQAITATEHRWQDRYAAKDRLPVGECLLPCRDVFQYPRRRLLLIFSFHIVEVDLVHEHLWPTSGLKYWQSEQHFWDLISTENSKEIGIFWSPCRAQMIFFFTLLWARDNKVTILLFLHLFILEKSLFFVYNSLGI